MKKTMKLFALMLALVMIAAAFVGCSKKGQEPDLTIEPDATVNEPAAMPELPADAGVAEIVTFEESGISMMQKPKTITTAMEEITFLIDNQSGKDYSTDMVQKLEKLEGDEWKEILPVHDAVTMNLIAVPNGTMTEISFLFAGYYEGIENGHYRMMKTLVDAEGNAITLGTEFDVL